VWIVALLNLAPRAGAAEADARIRFAGAPVELSVSEVSERTVRVELFALDEQSKPRPTTQSTVLVPFPTKEKLRLRELSGERELHVGLLRVLIKPQPLTVSVRRDDGRLVQELTFDSAGGTNAGVTFRTDAPVLGLGEGAQQFDRRGALYPMEPSWGGWNRPILGSVVPSPFLIGTDSWAIFAHRPEGQFDLRDGRGRFIPRQDAQGSALFDLFVVNVQNPANLVRRYRWQVGDARGALVGWPEPWTQSLAVLGQRHWRILSDARTHWRTLRAMVSILGILSVVPFARTHVAFAAAVGLEHGRIRTD